ncbi:MAG: hypothetical protein ACXVZN_04380 [Gaiellaceae bacterium]
MEGSAEPTFWRRLRSFFSGLTGFITATAALIVAVVGALTAVGVIGGGSGGTTHAAATAAMPSWASQANAICARSNDTVAALPQAKAGLGADEVTALVKTSATLGHQMLRDLTALTPPKGKEQEVATFLRLDAALNNDLDELTADLTLGKLAAAATRATSLKTANTRFNQAAIQLGATTCAEGSSLGDVSLLGG